MLAVMLAALITACSSTPPIAESKATGDGSHFMPTASQLSLTNANSLDNGMVLALENDLLALYIHPKTAEAALQDKRNGEWWYTNPHDGTGKARDKIGAQLMVQYYEDGLPGEYSSVTHSIANGQFQLMKTETGIRIVYTFSNKKVSLDEFPAEIIKERFDELLEQAGSDSDREELNKRYRFVEAKNSYEARKMSDFVMEKILNIIDNAGFKVEELSGKAAEKRDEGMDITKPAYLEIPLDYVLDGDQLVVSVDTQDIKVPPQFTLSMLKLLPYFGAADGDQKGYVFVPDGSGGLISLNRDKPGASQYRTQLYGRDGSLTLEENMDNSAIARLPVFGLKQGNRAWFSVIEQGDGIASINAEIRDKIQNYNIVYSQFNITPNDQMELKGNNKSNVFPVFPQERFRGTIVQRYFFLYNDRADYSGMASTYRNYLVETKGLSKKQQGENGDIPFYTSLIGSIPKQSSFLGIPYTSQVALTTFEQTKVIVEELLSRHVSNIKLRYEGWFNGGITHTIAQKISVEKDLGGASGLKELAQWLAAREVEWFPDVSFYNVYTDSSGFSATRDAARYISGKPVQKYNYNPANYQKVDGGAISHILSPSKIPAVVAKFAEAAGQYGLTGLALTDLGGELYSDFRNGSMIDRQQAASIVTNQLQGLHDGIGSLMMLGGNAYALPYADHILEAPLSGGGNNIIDEQVPFYQMVLHGYVNYAGEPLNLGADQDSRLYLLNMLETGASPFVLWSYQPSSMVKNTAFDYLYSIQYTDWLETAAQLYTEANEVLRKVSGKSIVHHSQIADNVYQTEYEQGLSITVNYNEHQVEVNGILIEARSYIVGGAGR